MANDTKISETMTLPETEKTAPGQNGLYRLNYFNGRFLTAEGLRKEQVYWDYRARLLGEIHPSGVAWGMSLTYDHTWKSAGKDPAGRYQPVGGMSAGTKVLLRPGLAFNGIGQPIAVGADFEFTFAQLMDQWKSNKTVVVDGGTVFAPCVCLAPMPGGGMPGGQALPAGPYLLLIDPRESLEGEAKVYTQVCPGKSTPQCEKDGVRGGFALSLARFPVDVPMEQIESAWDLRSILSAYYFGVYELSLIQRWARPFPLDEGLKDFCSGPGPFDRVPGHVPLAMVYVGSDGTILFVDPWIPRRSQAATASLGWHANLRGAPTAPAWIARLQQFQCQVHDRAEALEPSEAQRELPNLYDLGFREIPPFGFLPVPGYQRTGKESPLTLSRARVRWASRFAQRYFSNTNVIAYVTVAVHDDDIFEDMVRAAEKDSIVLRRCAAAGAVVVDQPSTYEPPLATTHRTSFASAASVALFQPLLRLFGKCGGITMERLINREIEVIKLVVPMEGVRRSYPIVGAVKADISVAPFAAWSALTSTAAPSDTWGPRIDALFGDVLGTAARPHGFVFYVKQRLVLLEWLYLALDAILDLLLIFQMFFQQQGKASAVERPSDAARAAAPAAEAGEGTIGILSRAGLDNAFAGAMVNSFRPARHRDARYAAYDTSALKKANQGQPLKAFDLFPALLENEATRSALVSGVLLWAPELGIQGTWTAYRRARDTIAVRLRAARPNDPTVDAEAREQAIDLLLREHKGFAVLKLAAVTLPEAEVSAFEELLQSEARVRGSRGEATLGQQAFYAGGYEVASTGRGQAMFDAARKAYGARALSDIAPELRGLPAVQVEDALTGTPRELKRVVGTRASTVVSRKIKADTQAVKESVDALASSPALDDAAFWRTYDEALAKHEGDDGKALSELVEAAPQHRAAVGELQRLHAALGERGYEEVLAAARGRSA